MEIAPVTLSAGSSYVIGGYVSPSDPIEYNITDLTTSPAISFRWGMAVLEDAFPWSQQGCCGTAFFGPNFGTADVPEPITWTTLVAGLMALGALVRRRIA